MDIWKNLLFYRIMNGTKKSVNFILYWVIL
nr:MAG TPA: hypothetical protein [Bacteriophage sp.]